MTASAPSAIALAGLALVGLALMGLGGAPEGRTTQRAALALCAVGVLLAAATLLAGAPRAAIDIPVGLPGASTRLALDGVSALFLLLVLGAGAAASHAGRCAPVAGAISLALLAGDGFALGLAIAATALATALHLPRRAPSGDSIDGARDGTVAVLAAGLAATLCLLAALALAGPATFEAIRLVPTGPWGGAAVLALVLLAAALVAALPAVAARGGATAALATLLSGATPALAAYLPLRVLFDLCGPGQPVGWGVALLAAGAIAAVVGGARAGVARELPAVFLTIGIAQTGLTATALGLAWIARAADLTTLAGLALGGAWLSVAAHALGATLLALSADTVQTAAGTRTLDRLGGLVSGMPVTTAATLVGVASLAAVPGTGGFAALWTILQAIVGAPRSGGLAIQLVLGAVAACSAIAASLIAAAGLRAVGIGFLGRPRSPRASAATEVARPRRRVLVVLTALLAVAGLLPTATRSLAAPAVRLLLAGRSPDAGGVLALPGASAEGGYSAAVIVALLVVAAMAAIRIARRRAPGSVSGPAWEGGFDPPPPWMPFGDPATQLDAVGLSPPLATGIAALARATSRRRGLECARSFARGVARTGDGATAMALASLAALLVAVAAALGSR